MFISKKEYNKLKLDISWNDLRICVLENLLKDLPDDISKVIDNNQAIIDTNKLVLDKLEEYLKANDAHE